MLEILASDFSVEGEFDFRAGESLGQEDGSEAEVELFWGGSVVLG